MAQHAAPMPESFVKRHVKALVIGTMIALVMASGVAFAAWLFNNVAGTGGAKTGTIVAPTMVAVAGADMTSTLLPGASGPLTLKVNNPNTVPLVLKSVDVNGSITSSNATLCPASNLTTPGLAATGLTITIPPGVTTVVEVPGNIVKLDAAAPTGCNGGITFGIPVLGNFATS